MTQLELAVADCRYARSLSEYALEQHFKLWESFDIGTKEEVEYHRALFDIQAQLDTDECLLKEA